MSWQNQLKGDPINWLLETENPGVRYLALRDLMDIPVDDPDLVEARVTAHREGPIAAVLKRMKPEGYWVKPGAGYSPKYSSTVWSLILLAQLGASSLEDKRINIAGSYFLDQALAPGGQISHAGTPSGTIDCLQGNMLLALMEKGYEDPRFDIAFDWMARTVTGEGIAPKTEKEAERRYYAYKCGPLFKCGANYALPCAWGATKVMLAFGKVPKGKRTQLINNAIQQGVDFLLGTDPSKADWPSGGAEKPSGNWWKFGFPVFYVTDILQVVEALVGLGYANDPRLSNAIELIRGKQDDRSRWLLEYDYSGKTWGNFGEKKQAYKWVTLRVLRVLKKFGS
jgi:hypothetical protein